MIEIRNRITGTLLGICDDLPDLRLGGGPLLCARSPNGLIGMHVPGDAPTVEHFAIYADLLAYGTRAIPCAGIDHDADAAYLPGAQTLTEPTTEKTDGSPDVQPA